MPARRRQPDKSHEAKASAQTSSKKQSKRQPSNVGFVILFFILAGLVVVAIDPGFSWVKLLREKFVDEETPVDYERHHVGRGAEDARQPPVEDTTLDESSSADQNEEPAEESDDLHDNAEVDQHEGRTHTSNEPETVDDKNNEEHLEEEKDSTADIQIPQKADKNRNSEEKLQKHKNKDVDNEKVDSSVEDETRTEETDRLARTDDTEDTARLEEIKETDVNKIAEDINGGKETECNEEAVDKDDNTPNLEWWQTTIIYQVYPRSFQDSDGDGIGDLKGITSRLGYIADLGVKTIWLSPFYPSPMADFGYDISNFTDVDPVFGTLEDFDELIKEVHSRGMRLVVDYIPNHSSNQHPWFLQSRLGGADNPYKDYYVWHDGKVMADGSRAPPNNWISIFAGSAWEWDDVRQQYYLHQFAIEQPDLNYRNPKVLQEMLDVSRFWLDRGVDGFRIDAILTMFEVENFPDEPRSMDPEAGDNTNDHAYLTHIYTMNQPENYDVTMVWREFFNDYEQKHNLSDHIYMVVELYDKPMVNAIKYYHAGTDAPFCFNLVYINDTCGGDCIFQLVNSWMERLPDGKWPHWVLGNHDQPRIATKKGERFSDVLNMLLLLLPGTPTTYYGEEIGMTNIYVSYEDTMDPHGKNAGKERYEMFNRDPARTPMQWSSEGVSGGFSTSEKTWLPLNNNFKSNNVEKQLQRKDSHLNVYRTLASLRTEPSFQSGKMKPVVNNKNIMSFVRHARGQDVYLVILHFGTVKDTQDYRLSIEDIKFNKGIVVFVTPGTKQSKNKEIDLHEIELNPGEGVVVRLVAPDS